MKQKHLANDRFSLATMVLLTVFFSLADLSVGKESAAPQVANPPVGAPPQEVDDATNAFSLWYDKPAAYRRWWWNDGGSQCNTLLLEGLLLGNGSLGAAVKGGVTREVLALSEKTLWTGMEGQNSKCFGSFQALGKLLIDLPEHRGETGYRRSLDTRDAICRTQYTAGGVTYRREYFISYPDQVLVIRLTADRKGAYTGALRFQDGQSRVPRYGKNLITTSGCLENEMRFETQILLLNEGGTQKSYMEEEEDGIRFKDCDALTILVAAGTDYALKPDRSYRSGEDPHVKVTKHITEAQTKDYETLKARHIEDYQRLHQRLGINLGTSTPEQRALPTDQRLAQAPKVSDPEFEALVCQYSRYLLIACSRPGDIPANGMGLWADNPMANFRGGYSTDISPTEISYWSAEPANLAECEEPFLDYIQAMIPSYRKATQSAPEFKLASGQQPTRGWEIRANHNPLGDEVCWWNKGGSAWYCHHFWEHYAFSNDREYLKATVYPMLKELCEFWEGHLKALPDGRLVVPNMTYSPEHGPFHIDGCSYCQELVCDLFTNYLDASELLGVDADYRAKVAKLKEKLLVPGVGSWGQLLEWMTDMKDWVYPPGTEQHYVASTGGRIDSPENHHRHCSHLLAVFPLRQITPETTPELAKAAKVSAIARGVGVGGSDFHPLTWSHRIPVFARLGDGEWALKLIRIALAKWESVNLTLNGGETAHTLGASVWFCEMLLQSHQGDIHVLPALPKDWHTGWVKGIRARGGYEVDESWKDGKLTSLTIHSIAGNDVKVRYGEKTVQIPLSPGKTARLNGNLEIEK